MYYFYRTKSTENGSKLFAVQAEYNSPVVFTELQLSNFVFLFLGNDIYVLDVPLFYEERISVELKIRVSVNKSEDMLE